jgi:hypothetical protein
MKTKISQEKIDQVTKELLSDFNFFCSIIEKHGHIILQDIYRLAYDLVNNKIYKVELQKKIRCLVHEYAIKKIKHEQKLKEINGNKN